MRRARDPRWRWCVAPGSCAECAGDDPALISVRETSSGENFSNIVVHRAAECGKVVLVNTNVDAAPEPQHDPKQDAAAWKAIVRKFQEPSLPRAIWQLVNTLGPYAALWYLMYLSLSWS